MDSIIDPAALKRLLQTVGGDKEFFNGLIDDFFVDTPKFLSDMQTALAERNAVELRRVAHGLKTNSASLGATELARLCAELEAKCKENVWEGNPELLAQIQNEYTNTQRALRVAKAQG